MSQQTPDPLRFENDPWAEGDPYELLGLPPGASRADVKSAYRALQKRSKRGDAAWTAAQVANERLTKPKSRLELDLFTLSEERKWEELVRLYAEVSFDLLPKDLAPLLAHAADAEWVDPLADFSVPPSPKLRFEPIDTAPGEIVELPRRAT
jgi:hypothetical protein